MATLGTDIETKVYCCSNTTKAEAKILSSFDIFCSVLFLIYSAWYSDMLINRPDEFRNTTMFDNSTLRDFNFLLDLEEQQQNFFVAGLLVWCGWNVALGGMLLFAAEKEKQGLLKVWFGVTLLEVLFGIFMVVLALWNMKRRVFISTTTVMVYLYKWYELWIVLGLIRDLHSGSTVFAKEQLLLPETAAANPPKAISAKAQLPSSTNNSNPTPLSLKDNLDNFELFFTDTI